DEIRAAAGERECRPRVERACRGGDGRRGVVLGRGREFTDGLGRAHRIGLRVGRTRRGRAPFTADVVAPGRARWSIDHVSHLSILRNRVDECAGTGYPTAISIRSGYRVGR